MMRIITDPAELRSALTPFVAWIPKSVIEYLAGGISSGVLECHFDNLDENESQWDGELVVKWKKKPGGYAANCREIVNNLIGPAKADEVDMLDDFTLRLWWD
jgi:hypothetical protein